MVKKDEIANILDFSGLKISIASPEDILSWSHGEVTKPETINYRTLRPEKDGLFDERIFGPTKDWECYCGKYKRIRYRGIICDKCGVEVTQSRVRRERMGHIKLAAPIVHVWFFRGAPSKLSILLNISPRLLENVIYFAQYLVTNVDKQSKEKAKQIIGKKGEEKKNEIAKVHEQRLKDLKLELEIEEKESKKKIKDKESRELFIDELELRFKQRKIKLEQEEIKDQERSEQIYKETEKLIKTIVPKSLLTEDEYLRLRELECAFFFNVGMGAEALLEVIRNLDLTKLAADLRKNINKLKGQKRIKATKRLRVVEGFKKANLNPEWIILTILPVLPPDLRPMVQLTGGRFATSDLNDLYRRVINRNNRLKHLINLGAPEIILRNEKRMLQEAVDSLIDATQRPSSRRTRSKRQKLRSLSDMLRGKQGRFRQNLLGKRVDYSGRSVIVVGPELNLTQCGLPKEMALEIFKPFVLRELIARGFCPNVKSAKNFLERKPPEVFDILEEITKNHPVLLNRAPTLHKLGIQSFYPILIEGSAIRIHPCVCAGYNADFDGDQMAVHIPLSKKAQYEAINLMLPIYNLLKPADGSPITLPNKEMALGCYYLTSFDNSIKGREDLFSDEQEAILAYQFHKIKLREKIKVRINGETLETSVGRIFFNEVLPKDLRFINQDIRAATLKDLTIKVIRRYPSEIVGQIIDAFKDLGFWAATIAGGMSVSVFDNEIIPEKKKMVNNADKKVAEIDNNFKQGLITDDERRRLSNEVWIDTTEKLANATWSYLTDDNPVKIIIESGGARASKDQLKQLAAIRGLVVDPLGKIVEMPTKSNFREGLSIFEYVTSTRGSRKGLTDSALKTADAGYLTRRLVDVSHDVIIRIRDCKTTEGIEIDVGRRTTPFIARILGRILAKKITNKKGKVLIAANEELNEDNLDLIIKNKIKKVIVRSPLTCQAKYGICALCYGRNLSTRKIVELGTPVGVIAAQSIGEPGTQLTMRVRHTGGIVGLDVTQGLPRVEELFEARTPKVLSPLSEISGRVEVIELNTGYKIRIKSVGIKPAEEREYDIPLTSILRVKDGQLIGAGEQLASGFLDIKEILQIKGIKEAQKYLLNQVQAVYESQGIPINDKHFEVIIRKMGEKVKVDNPGDTGLLPGELIEKANFEDENAAILAEGGEPASGQCIILGITRAALYTESWLSAASFQETTNVLTDAASRGKEDKLLGLKENVIIGRLIPTSEERARINNM